MNIYKRKTLHRFKIDPDTGRERRCKPGETADRTERVESAKWYGGVPGPDGKKKPVPLATDKTAALVKLAGLLKAAERGEVGLVDPFKDHRGRPLFCRACGSRGAVGHYKTRRACDCPGDPHLTAYRRHLAGKGTGEVQRRKVCGYLSNLFAACGWATLADAAAADALAHLERRRDAPAGLSAHGYNDHVAALKAFGAWAVADGRAADHSFGKLAKIDGETGRRHVRRAGAGEELAAILAAAAAGPDRRGLSGRSRAVLYLIAVSTGFRAKELSALTPRDFDPDGPTLTLPGRHAKNKRATTLPVRPEVAAVLADFIDGRPAGTPATAPLWPGNWREKAAAMLRRDLAAAGVPYRVGADGDDLSWADDRGERRRRGLSAAALADVRAGSTVLDFHALRTTFGTELARAGVAPQTAQRLMRHADYNTTMRHYAALGLSDLADGLDRLPVHAPAGPPGPRPDAAGEPPPDAPPAVLFAPCSHRVRTAGETGRRAGETGTGAGGRGLPAPDAAEPPLWKGKRDSPGPRETRRGAGEKKPSVGLEPTTYALRERRSTTELRRRWCRQRDGS